MEAFDAIRAGVRSDRSQFYKDLSLPFFGANREGAKVSDGVRETFWLLSMQCGLKAAYDCIHEFSESDFHADLVKFDVPTLIVHGDDDQIVPILASAIPASKLISNASLKIYEGGSHGLTVTDKNRFNADLLMFARS
jgi:non-heme chloroperoxidase